MKAARHFDTDGKILQSCTSVLSLLRRFMQSQMANPVSVICFVLSDLSSFEIPNDVIDVVVGKVTSSSNFLSSFLSLDFVFFFVEFVP
jgi:hypothetical protein